ncbi:MAG: glycosyltransferase family 4 protein [Chitinophagales bacterium]|nr:glycosyltransferase family 4 protein [Chitinophagales bacterium]
MNILFLTYQGDMAGSTRSIFYLADGLAKKGHNVFVGCRKESLLFSLVENSNATPVAMSFSGRLDFKNIREIRQIVNERKIQIINAQSSYDRYTSILARLFYKLPVKIFHTRRQRPRSDGGWIQKQFYIKGTDGIIVVSEELKRMFIAKGYPANHIHVIYNGVPENINTLINDNTLESLRKQHAIASHDTVVGCISRKKSQEELIRALKFMDPAIKVLFVGIDKEFLQDEIERESPKQEIIFAGKKDWEETLHYYKLCTLNVLPSRMDGFGLVIVESMLLGTPVVGANKGGIINLIENGVSGLIYEFGNPEDLAKKIQTLLDDRTKKDAMIQNGLNRAKRFSVAQTVINYENFFQSFYK